MLKRISEPLGECAALSEEADSLSEEVRVFRLDPTPSSNAARIRVYASDDADELYLEVGENTRFEIQVGERRWRQTGRPAIDELEALCRAVVAGNFEERVWYAEGQITRSKGILVVDGQPLESSTRSVGKAFLAGPSNEVAIRYGPYCNEPRTSAEAD